MASAKNSVREDLWNVPNIMTMGRIVLIPFICWFLMRGVANDSIEARWHCVWASVLFGIASVTDYFDGYIARRRNLVSLTGKFLDPLADKLLVMAVFCTLLTAEKMPLWFVVLAIGREMSVTGLRALAAGEGMIIAADWGGKWKTAWQLVGLVCVIIHHTYHVEFGLFTLVIRFHHVGFILLLLSLVYSLLSGWTYFADFLRNLDKAASKSAA